ncbi:MAG: restriction endonuclease [Sphingosinicella sp.]
MQSAPEIPLDIRDAMHDCILAVMWPRKKIIEFFASVDCPAHLIPPADTPLSRHLMVVDVFSKLSARPDRGHGVFQTMVDRLANWSYFDPYYFDRLQKLDRGEALKTIARLKSAVDKRNAATQSRRAASSDAQKQQVKAQDLSALKSAFAKMYGTDLTPQARGRLFEHFLRELFSRQSIQMGDHFRLKGEEIDGTFKFEGENYIVEAKWQDPSVSTGQLYKFAHKVDGKMHGRGLFISVNGFSHEGIEAIVHGKHIQTLLMDGQDLSFVLEDLISLEAMLDYKIRAAQTRGDVYVCAVRETVKI